MATDAPQPGTPLPWNWKANLRRIGGSDGDWVLYDDEREEWRILDADVAYIVYAANELPKAVEHIEQLVEALAQVEIYAHRAIAEMEATDA